MDRPIHALFQDDQDLRGELMKILTFEPVCRYFTDKDKAYLCHYLEGGTLYKRRDDAPKCVKQWANGDLPASRSEWYEPFMINGGRQQQ